MLVCELDGAALFGVARLTMAEARVGDNRRLKHQSRNQRVALCFLGEGKLVEGFNRWCGSVG